MAASFIFDIRPKLQHTSKKAKKYLTSDWFYDIITVKVNICFKEGSSMKIRNIMSLILCVAVLFSVLVSCTDRQMSSITSANDDGTRTPTESVSDTEVVTTQAKEETSNAAAETTTAITTTAITPPAITTENVTQAVTNAPDTSPSTTQGGSHGYIKDDLPDRVFNDEFRLFTWNNAINFEFEKDAKTGENFSFYIALRNEYLKQMYGIDISITGESGDWSNVNSFVKRLEASVNEVGGNPFDAVGCYFAAGGALSIKGLTANLADKEIAPYLDLSKPWWPSDMVEKTLIKGALYAVTGDITPTFVRNISVCYVNLPLFERYNPGVNVYDLVRNKEWTYDKLVELTVNKVSQTGTLKAVTMNSNVVYDDIFYSSGMTLTETLDDGSVTMHEFNADSRFLDFYGFSFDFLEKNDNVKFATLEASFANGSSVVHFGNASLLQDSFADVNFEYACVPYPMYVTSAYRDQNEYHTVPGFWTTLYSIPTNCSDYELASFTLEALASYGYRFLTPTWINERFSNSSPNKVGNMEMIELCRDSASFDIARVFGTHINCFAAFREAGKMNPDWHSYLYSKTERWNQAINEINQKLG